MGNENSRPTTLYGRVSKAIPPMAPQYGMNDNSEWVDKGVKAFASEGDREQFIYGLISLLTSNGAHTLENHDIKLLFSRRHRKLPDPSLIPSNPPTPSSSSKPGWRALMPGSPSEPDDGTRLTASLVAIDEAGVIRVKVASEEAEGRDVGEAFRAFKKDVEIKLGRLLNEVPDGTLSGNAGARQETRAAQRVTVGARTVEQRGVGDAPPPAYGDVDVKKG